MPSQKTSEKTFALGFLATIWLTAAVHIQISATALAHGFTANFVKITKEENGTYKIKIKYTHIQAGEYREAHIYVKEKNEAIKKYYELVKGAEFFLGANSANSIHFHEEDRKEKREGKTQGSTPRVIENTNK